MRHRWRQRRRRRARRKSRKRPRGPPRLRRRRRARRTRRWRRCASSSAETLTAKQVHERLPGLGFELTLSAVKKLCSEAIK